MDRKYLENQASILVNLYNSKKFNEAVQKGKILIKKFPNQLMFYNATALSLSSLGENDEALRILKEGLELIFNKLTNSLKSNGLELMNVKEQDFNADEHEAITNIPAPSQELQGKIIEVIEQGYILNGKIIRFPKVVVGT